MRSYDALPHEIPEEAALLLDYCAGKLEDETAHDVERQ